MAENNVDQRVNEAVAGAYLAAVHECIIVRDSPLMPIEPCTEDLLSQRIRALTPADATAALAAHDKEVAAAVRVEERSNAQSLAKTLHNALNHTLPFEECDIQFCAEYQGDFSHPNLQQQNQDAHDAALRKVLLREIDKEYRQYDGWARQSDIERAIERALPDADEPRRNASD